MYAQIYFWGFFSYGFYYWKSRKPDIYYKYEGQIGKELYYAYRQCEPETGYQIVTIIPIINVIYIPSHIGYYCGTLHDKLLYKLRPQYYQNKIDKYLELRKKINKQEQEDRRFKSYGGTGNTQITFF